MFQSLHSMGPFLPSLKHSSSLGWNSWKVAAKNTGQQDKDEQLESEFHAPIELW